ncbi:MAG TPA: DUF3821 domain-containing protein [Methanomicrobiales archaeon]|nr:DUF3821 domain-containing protein [Methanomicrobiales archaeon]
MRAHSRSRITPGILAGGILLLLLSALAVCPSGARTDIRHIGVGDTIFVYEQNIDITGLRTGANPVTALRKYQDDNPTMVLLREVAVTDDTSYTPIPESFGGTYGVYYAWNSANGVMNSALVAVPTVSIDAVLASPNHSDSIEGLSISERTPIAFKIVSVDVGAYYHAGALYPATVDVVLTTPGGAQLTNIQGLDFSRMNVSAQVFYTDDPGRPGAITLQNLGSGSFTVQAKWHDPANFDMMASDSNILGFNIGGAVVPTTVPVPPVTVPVTTVPIVTTIPATPPPTTRLPPVTTTAPATLPPTTAVTTPQQSPAPAPLGAWPGVLSIAVAALLIGSRRLR